MLNSRFSKWLNLLPLVALIFDIVVSASQRRILDTIKDT